MFLFGCLSLITPRVILALVFIFNRPYLAAAYQTIFWPVMGFLFMPLTTLAWAYAIHTNGRLDGVYLALYILAVLIDLGSLGSGEHSRRRMRRRRR